MITASTPTDAYHVQGHEPFTAPDELDGTRSGERVDNRHRWGDRAVAPPAPLTAVAAMLVVSSRQPAAAYARGRGPSPRASSPYEAYIGVPSRR